MEVYSWESVPEEKINDDITRQMFWGENIMVVKWQLAPNASMPEHEHEAEQVTMVHTGSVTLCFSDDRDVTVKPGDMLVIPPSVPHSVKVGPEGCLVTDLFSPIREDFIEGTAAYLGSGEEEEARRVWQYKKFRGYLASVGVKIELEELMKVQLDILARYAYEKQCVTMGQLREILGMDKKQAKALLREWKHGDDHSQSSYEKMLRTLVMLPEQLK
ncbi:cupin domain-containing protein [Thermodesulfobacteriota bacterium]